MLIRVIYRNGKYDMIKPSFLDELILSKKIRSFMRSGGWATVGADPVRGAGGIYQGIERRRTSELFETLS